MDFYKHTSSISILEKQIYFMRVDNNKRMNEWLVVDKWMNPFQYNLFNMKITCLCLH